MTQIIHNYSSQATRTRPWENWVEPQRISRHSLITVGADGSAYLDVQVPPPKAKYFGMTVTVVQRMEQLAVIDWEGHRLLVEVGDLEAIGAKEVAV